MLHLARNLDSLRIHRPAAAAVIEKALEPTRYRFFRADSGAVTIAEVSDPAHPICLSAEGDPAKGLPKALTTLEPVRRSGQCTALVGIGDGYLLGAIARSAPPLFMDMQEPIHLIEPDPQLLAMCLMLHDYTGPGGPIEQPRFAWHVGEDWETSYRHAMLHEPFTVAPGALARQSLAGEPLQDRVQAITDERVTLQQSLRRKLDAYYETSLPGVADLLGDNPPRRPRVVGLTSRFTTVLQYSARDALAGFEANGWETRLLIEPDLHHRVTPLAILRLLDEFKPDLFLVMDHLRASTGDVLPPRLTHACWVQDLLPNLCSRQAGASVGPRDFVLTFAAPMFITDFGYPKQQCIDAPMMLAPIVKRPDEWTSDGADLCYVSHLSAEPAQLIEEALGRCDAAARPLVESACRWLTGCYEAGRSVHTKQELRRGVRQLAPNLSSDAQRLLVDLLWNPLNIALYRQQALTWAADAADELGLTLWLFGRGWEGHQRFARYARGVVTPGRELEELARRTKINLNLEPYPCVTHSRLLAGLSAGGFFLIRAHPANTLIAQVSALLLRGGDLSEVLEQARCLCFGAGDDPVAQVRSYERAGVVVPGQPLLPNLADVSFADTARCQALIARFVHDADLRRQIAQEQRAAVEERLGVAAGMRRACARIAQVLRQQSPALSGAA